MELLPCAAATAGTGWRSPPKPCAGGALGPNLSLGPEPPVLWWQPTQQRSPTWQGAPAWPVTLFLSSPLGPRKCPIAGYPDRAASLSLALRLIFCVLAESLSLAMVSRARGICPIVLLSFSPGFLPAPARVLPSWLSPACWLSAHRSSLLSAMSSDVPLCDTGGRSQISLPQLPDECVPGSAAHPVLLVSAQAQPRGSGGARRGRGNAGSLMVGWSQPRDWGQMGRREKGWRGSKG